MEAVAGSATTRPMFPHATMANSSVALRIGLTIAAGLTAAGKILANATVLKSAEARAGLLA